MAQSLKFLSNSNEISGRQIAFFSAFLLPVYKLLETPSILATFVQGDLLLPAILHFSLQGILLFLLLFLLSKQEISLFERLEKRLGKWSACVYIPFAFYFLFSAILPLLDGEKFVYAAFFDTAPTLFSFGFFFIVLAFACTKNIKTVGRISDLCFFLFLIPFFILIAFSLSEAKFSNLLPFFEMKFADTMYAFTYTSPHFSDLILLFPLLGNLRYQKGDGVKIGLGYGVGALCTLLFLSVFYGVYSTLAFKQHYAFLKIAQYFPALTLVGRIDLLFVYSLSIVFFFYLCLPLQFSVDFFARVFHTQKTILAGVVSVVAFLFVLYANPFYNTFYRVFCEKLFFLFWIFTLLVLLVFFLFHQNKNKQNAPKKYMEKFKKNKE